MSHAIQSLQYRPAHPQHHSCKSDVLIAKKTKFKKPETDLANHRRENADTAITYKMVLK